MKFHSFIEFDSILFPLFILSRQVFFSSRTMASLHHHHHWWLSFIFFILVSSSPTSVATHLDRCFYQKFNPEPLYFHHISSGGPAVPHQLQYGGRKFRAEGHNSLPASATFSEHSGAKLEGRGWFQGDNWRGAVVAVDNKEPPPNNNSDTDYLAFA